MRSPLWVLLYYSYFAVLGQSDTSGPVFIQEPPNNVDFSNTTGTKIICQARGVPLPNITWTKADGEPIGTVPGLRQVKGLVVKFFWSGKSTTTFQSIC